MNIIGTNCRIVPKFLPYPKQFNSTSIAHFHINTHCFSRFHQPNSQCSYHMTTLNNSSSSAAESTMEDLSSHHHRSRHKKPHQPSVTTTTVSTTTGESDGEVDDAEYGDPEVWATFNKSFRQVQSVLDRNRLLIQQVNENHQSRTADNMVKNVSLIQELNGNISKVVHIYSDLNFNFSTMCQQTSKNNGRRRES